MMKKIALLLPLMALVLVVNAQSSAIDDLFDKYYGKEGFTTVLVNEEMFEVISNMEKESGELEGVLGKIKRIRVIAQEDECTDTEGEKAEGVNFMEELKGFKFDDYKELVVVKESDEEVLVLAREEDGQLAELLVLVGGEENVLVSIEGRFSMEDLEALSDLEGLEELEDIFEY
jgi:hypothetical protein